MEFRGHAGATIADRGPDDTSRKPPLAEAFRRNSVDPLSALERIREELRTARPGGSFTVPVYDGARRFDVIAKVLPGKGANDPKLRLQLMLSPIAGFKGEASDDGDPDSAPRPVEVTISDDARLLPLSMQVSVAYLPLVVELAKSCDGGAVRLSGGEP